MPLLTAALAVGLVSLLLAGLSFALNGGRSSDLSAEVTTAASAPADLILPTAAPTEEQDPPTLAVAPPRPSPLAASRTPSPPVRPKPTTATRPVTPKPSTTHPAPAPAPLVAEPPATHSAPAERPRAAPKAAPAPAPAPVAPKVAAAPPAASGGATIVAYARQLAGQHIPYVLGGKTTKGFDCSGFVWYVLNHVGISQPYRTSSALKSWATPISAGAAVPGDLVFYPGHVAIFVGGGRVVDAGNSALGVTERPMWAGATFGRIPK